MQPGISLRCGFRTRRYTKPIELNFIKITTKGNHTAPNSLAGSGYTLTREQIATGIAITFHTVVFILVVFFDRSYFIKSISLNLLLMCCLLFYTQKQFNKWIFLFALACFITGISAEMLTTGAFNHFNSYEYGSIAGPAIWNVPLVIGVSWFILIYCAGVTVQTVLNKIIERISLTEAPKPTLKALSVVIDGATLVILFDWLAAPVATKLGIWQWNNNGDIPFFNYLWWFTISVLLLAMFHYSKFNKHNKFAINLLLIQAMFFLLLRTWL